VRFVLYWDDFEPNRGDWDQVNLSTLDTAVRRAKAAGLYVILDEIHLVGRGGFDHVPRWARIGDSVTTVERNGAAYLRMLASRYRAERAVAAYDPVNEFHRWPIDQDGVLRAYDYLIRQIRSVDPERIILVEPTYGDTSVAGGLADFSNLTDRRNVVWSIHDYFAGGDDDGYGADGGQVGTYTWNSTAGYPVPDPKALERHLLVHLAKARSARLPVWIGEFGIGERAVNRDRWIDDQVRLFDKYGLGRAWWEYDGAGPFSATKRDASWKPWVRRLVGTQSGVG
jgi:Cellulase (glycosyl hydrolase family 5)